MVNDLLSVKDFLKFKIWQTYLAVRWRDFVFCLHLDKSEWARKPWLHCNVNKLFIPFDV